MTIAGIAPLRPRTADINWDTTLASVLAEPERVRPAFQPIFDLRQGIVAGFEMLARFEAPVNASPLEWLAAAGARGLGTRLEAQLLSAGLRARRILHDSCFLAINLGPEALLSNEVTEVLRGRSLDGVVVEIAETGPAVDYTRLEPALGRLREAGARVAIDDTGAGYSSLQHVMQLRPSYVKLDRRLVSQIDSDPAKLALVEAMGSLAVRLDASIVAEGVERSQEREALAALGVPLAQGFALGRPEREIQAGLRLPVAAPRGDGVHVVQREATVVTPGHVPQVVANRGALPGSSSAVVVDDDGRPVGLLVRAVDGGWRMKRELLCVEPMAPVAEVAQRGMARPPEDRFDPIISCDETGRYMGLIAVDELVQELSRAAA